MVDGKRLERCKTCGRRNRRSNGANALYWLLLHKVAETLRPGGQEYSADQYHLFMKTRFLGADDVRLPNGKVMTVAHSTASLDAGEFNEYLTQVQAWAAERNVYMEELPA